MPPYSHAEAQRSWLCRRASGRSRPMSWSRRHTLGATERPKPSACVRLLILTGCRRAESAAIAAGEVGNARGFVMERHASDGR
jgi:hypothetical protein